MSSPKIEVEDDIDVKVADITMGNIQNEECPSRDSNQEKVRRSVLEGFDPLFNTSIDRECSVNTDKFSSFLLDQKFDNSNEDDVRKQCAITVNEIVDEALHTIDKQEVDTTTIQDMADSTDLLTLQTEISNLKLKINASQQVTASVELELRRKEELILKLQTELLRTDQLHRQEVEALKERLEKNSSEFYNTKLHELEDSLKLAETKEEQLINDLNSSKNEERNYRKVLEEYEKTFAEQFSSLTKLKEEHETAKKHLANLELAFSDVHEKYERSKIIINGFRNNEATLRDSLTAAESNLQKYEEKYESLKAHAKAQIEKCNQEIQLVREQQESEVHKLNAFIKRSEIKIVSLEDLLDQKTKECTALSLLCDEVTGRVE